MYEYNSKKKNKSECKSETKVLTFNHCFGFMSILYQNLHFHGFARLHA